MEITRPVFKEYTRFHEQGPRSCHLLKHQLGHKTWIMYIMFSRLFSVIDVYRGRISLKKGSNLLPATICHLFIASSERKSLLKCKVGNYSASFEEYTWLQWRKNSISHHCLFWSNGNKYRCKLNFIITHISHHFNLLIYKKLAFKK